jgi:long-chain acyl-CoA synthetase
MVMLFYLTQGVSIYFVDDISKIPQYLQQVRPNLFTTVPRLLEKAFNKIKQKSQHGNILSRLLLKIAFYKAKNFSPTHKTTFSDLVLDFLLYRKLRAFFGGKVQTIICGGAALPQEIEKFLHNIGLAVYCGYGLTESSPVLATNCQARYQLGTVGACFPSVKLKLAPDGELLASGKNIMLGYFKEEEQTKQVLQDGWLHTGDLAEIKDEFIKIIGRKKELLKTSNGKYVMANYLQQLLQQQITGLLGSVIIAEGKPFVSALLFFESENLAILQKQYNQQNLNIWIEQEITKINRQLDSWQQIKKFCIITEQISIENEQITPSYKLKTNILQQQFATEIAKFYEIT